MKRQSNVLIIVTFVGNMVAMEVDLPTRQIMPEADGSSDCYQYDLEAGNLELAKLTDKINEVKKMLNSSSENNVKYWQDNDKKLRHIDAELKKAQILVKGLMLIGVGTFISEMANWFVDKA